MVNRSWLGIQTVIGLRSFVSDGGNANLLPNGNVADSCLPRQA
jgi:hypothetical protein